MIQAGEEGNERWSRGEGEATPGDAVRSENPAIPLPVATKICVIYLEALIPFHTNLGRKISD